MNDNAKKTPAALAGILGDAPAGRVKPWRKWLAAVVVIALAIGAWLMFSGNGDDPANRYLTEEATQGKLVVSVSATGTLQPTKSVDVGSELSGTLAKVLVEENDYVEEGQLLAELDTAKLDDAVTKSKAALAAAEAAVAQTSATMAEAKASLARMQQVAELSGGKVPAKTELETAEAVLQRAIANGASAQAEVVQARATLTTDQTNLGKATIRSPINGVVLSRKVEPGQTVAATMTTPVLFTLAEDLKTMELQVQVDEADVSTVEIGQPATFTVAAWPSRDFPANIRRVGLGSTITDNVVTYKTVLEVRNDDLALRPGMTATASIVTADRDGALLVPNAALRFTPAQADAAKTANRSVVSSLLPGPPRGAGDQKRPATAVKAGSAQQVWVLDKTGPRAIPVKTGVTNGRLTEILDGELKPGMAVITEQLAAKK